MLACRHGAFFLHLASMRSALTSVAKLACEHGFCMSLARFKKSALAFLLPLQWPHLRGPGPAVESASGSAHSKPLAHVVRHAG